MKIDFEVRRVTARETLELRHRILRPHQTLRESMIPGDADPETFHVGVFVGGHLVSTGNVRIDAPPGGRSSRADRAGAWRLRGMGTELDQRGRGFGRAVLEACVLHVLERGGHFIWCNARATAIGFYEQNGFRGHGDSFDLPQIGPHIYMERDLR